MTPHGKAHHVVHCSCTPHYAGASVRRRVPVERTDYDNFATMNKWNRRRAAPEHYGMVHVHATGTRETSRTALLQPARVTRHTSRHCAARLQARSTVLFACGGACSWANHRQGVCCRQIARGAILRPKKSEQWTGEFPSATSRNSPSRARPSNSWSIGLAATLRQPSGGYLGTAGRRRLPCMLFVLISSRASNERGAWYESSITTWLYLFHKAERTGWADQDRLLHSASRADSANTGELSDSAGNHWADPRIDGRRIVSPSVLCRSIFARRMVSFQRIAERGNRRYPERRNSIRLSEFDRERPGSALDQEEAIRRDEATYVFSASQVLGFKKGTISSPLPKKGEVAGIPKTEMVSRHRFDGVATPVIRHRTVQAVVQKACSLVFEVRHRVGNLRRVADLLSPSAHTSERIEPSDRCHASAWHHHLLSDRSGALSPPYAGADNAGGGRDRGFRKGADGGSPVISARPGFSEYPRGVRYSSQGSLRKGRKHFGADDRSLAALSARLVFNSRRQDPTAVAMAGSGSPSNAMAEIFLQGRAARSARVAHNHEVVGSNPVSATSFDRRAA